MEKKQVLIVEDESVVALDLQSRLTSLGYAVPAIASYGEEAIRKAEKLRPALVLMDVRLRGEMDGVEAAEQIRSRFDIPVVYLTAHSDGITLQRAKITEPFGYLLKPFNERELHTTIEMALSKHQMERRLKENERLLAMTFASLRDALFIVAADTVEIIDCNPAASEIFGYSRQEMSGRAIDFLLVDEAALAEFRAYLDSTIEEKGGLHLPRFRMKRKNGSIFPSEHNTVPLKDETGKRFGWVTVVRDITEHVRAEEALRESEGKYRALFASSPESITLVDLDGIILDCNDATGKISGYPRNEMIGKPFLELGALHESELSQGIEIFQRLSNGEEIDRIEFRAPLNGNQDRWIEVFPALLKKDGTPYAIQVITRDITERKLMEQEIRRHNEALAALNAVSAAAVSSLELDTVLREILARTCRALNAPAGSILLVEPGTGELFFAVSLLEDQIHTLRRHRLAPGQGIAGWVIQHGEPVRVDDVRRDSRWYSDVDASTGFDTRSLLCAPLKHRDQTAGVIQIISEREGAFSDDDLSLLFAMAFISAAALEKTRLYAAAQSRVRELTLLNEIGLTVNSTLDRTQVIQAALSLVQHLFPADGILLLQPDLRTGELNFVQALTRTGSIEVSFSLSPGEGIAGWAMEHRQATLVKNAQDDPRFSDRLDRFLGTRTRALMAAPLLVPEGVSGVLEVISWQMSLYTSDDLRALQSVASTLAVALENARLYAEQTRLLQEREQAQEQLIHSEKMSALGRLASSIAHEINNPLQAIQGCMTLASEELEGQQRPEKLKRYFGIVSSEIERIANLGRRMRDFYRPARAGRTLTDVHDVLASVLELSNKQLEQSDIAIERHWAAELPMVYANPDHLQQVFLNLFINAIDAMPRGGTLSIATSMDWLPGNGHQFNSPHIPPVRAVRIDLSDTGVGMSLETQSRLFEPFFTSKEYGSGLGLSISYGIIQSHRGQIKVESKEGIGTTFTILLPTAETLQASEERP